MKINVLKIVTLDMFLIFNFKPIDDYFENLSEYAKIMKSEENNTTPTQ